MRSLAGLAIPFARSSKRHNPARGVVVISSRWRCLACRGQLLAHDLADALFGKGHGGLPYELGGGSAHVVVADRCFLDHCSRDDCFLAHVTTPSGLSAKTRWKS